jgi:hypothetical protein
MKSDRTQIGAGCRSVGVNTHRAATGRKRRARVSRRDRARKMGLSRLVAAATLRPCSRKVSHRRAAPFRSRLCGCRLQARSRQSCAFLDAARVTPLIVTLRPCKLVVVDVTEF